jgi:Flp pilus assembly protein TadD
LREDPENPSILYHIGVCYNRMDEPAKAIAPLKRVIELAPENGRALYFLGVAYDRAGMVDEARAHYRAADAQVHANGSRRVT